MTTGTARVRRFAVGALAALTAVFGLVPLAAAPAGAAAGFSFRRFAGENRFDTARRIAIDAFGTAQTVLLARGDLFPDALAGNYLAGSTGSGAPILLTRVESLPAETNDALTALGATRVIILGGPAAVSTNVEQQLRARNIQVDRVAGENRFETAQRVAERPGAANVGSVEGQRTAVIASGRNFPDALAGGPVSYASKLPTVLVEPNRLPSEARAALQNLAIRRAYLLGGPAAVSVDVENEIRALGITVTRLQGANRQATAIAIADEAISKLGFSDAHVNLARGDGFADALSGGPHGGKEKGVIVLTQSPTALSTETRDYLQRRSATLTAGHIFGGEAAVSSAVEEEATRAALSGRASVTLDRTQVPQGGTITGRIAGDNIQSVTVSGCGFNNQTVTRDSGGSFSLTLPASQGAGTCTLTFTTRFNDGTTETDSFQITVGSGASASANAAPELLSISFVRTVNQPGTVTAFDQSTFRFTFDEAIIGKAPTAANFFLYRFDRTLATPPNGRYRAATAQIDPNDSSSVLAVFGNDPNAGAPADVNRNVGSGEVAQITLGAVDNDAVRDNTGKPNPEGDAPVNTVSFSAGRTVGPDLINVGNFRPNFDGSRTLVDFTFDSRAVNVTPTGYHLVLNNSDADDRECTFLPGPTDSTTNGNNTPVHTASCLIVAGQQLTAGAVARGYVISNTVAAPNEPPNQATTPHPTVRNPTQVFDVTGNGETSRPELVSVTFLPDTNVTDNAVNVDTAIYTFDEAVLTANNANTCPAPLVPAPAPAPAGTFVPRDTSTTNGNCFRVFFVNGREVSGFSGPDPSTPGPARSSTNPNEVIVTFPDGTLNDAVGASVQEGGVVEAVATGGINRPNRVDQVAVRSQNFSSGGTTGPDLVRCRVEGTTLDPVTGEPQDFRAVFVFDEAVSATMGPAASFHLYNAAGDQILGNPAPVRRNAPNTNEVVVGFSGGTGTFAREELRSAVTCGVDEGAVTENTTNGSPNPIGGEVVSRS